MPRPPPARSKQTRPSPEKPAQVGLNQALAISQPCWTGHILRWAFDDGKMLASSSQQIFASLATAMKERHLLPQYSRQSPQLAGSHWTALGHMTMPEPITGIQGMEIC